MCKSLAVILPQIRYSICWKDHTRTSYWNPTFTESGWNRQNTTSPKMYLYSNSWNLWICDFTWKKKKTFQTWWSYEMGRLILDYPDGPNAITRVLKRIREDVRTLAEIDRDSKMLCFWVWRQRRGHEPGNAGRLSKAENQGREFSPDPPEETQPCRHPDFSLVKPVSDFGPLEFQKIRNLCCFKALGW